MNLPKILKDLLKAQELFDSTSFSRCFSDNALIFDEGKIYKGREEIKQWNKETNSEYKTLFEVTDFSTEDTTTILKINISGSFDGSPVMLKFHFRIEDNVIAALVITY
jgi:hypothetical protein